MNILYSMWWLEDIAFYKGLPLLLGVFPTTMLLHSLKQVFWKKSVFYVISTITVQFYYQSSPLNLLYTILTKFPYLFFLDYVKSIRELSSLTFLIMFGNCFTFLYKRCFSNEIQKFSESISFYKYVSKENFLIPLIFYVYKGRTESQMARWQV